MSLSAPAGWPSPCSHLTAGSAWLHCSALLCSFLSPSFFKIAGCQLQPHWVLRQHHLKAVFSGSHISVCGDMKSVAMPPCPPQWCPVPWACWVSSKPLRGCQAWAATCSPANPEESKGHVFGRRGVLGWIFLQGPLHPKAGRLLQPFSFGGSWVRRKCGSTSASLGRQKRGSSPIFLPRHGGGCGGLDGRGRESSSLRPNRNVTARCDDGQCLRVSITKHLKSENQTICLSVGFFFNLQTSGAGEQTVVQAWGGEPVAPGAVKYHVQYFLGWWVGEAVTMLRHHTRGHSRVTVPLQQWAISGS